MYFINTSVNPVHNARVELPLARSFPPRAPPPPQLGGGGGGGGGRCLAGPMGVLVYTQ
jgi:hypothetical protein